MGFLLAGTIWALLGAFSRFQSDFEAPRVIEFSASQTAARPLLFWLQSEPDSGGEWVFCDYIESKQYSVAFLSNPKSEIDSDSLCGLFAGVNGSSLRAKFWSLRSINTYLWAQSTAVMFDAALQRISITNLNSHGTLPLLLGWSPLSSLLMLSDKRLHDSLWWEEIQMSPWSTLTFDAQLFTLQMNAQVAHQILHADENSEFLSGYLEGGHWTAYLPDDSIVPPSENCIISRPFSKAFTLIAEDGLSSQDWSFPQTLSECGIALPRVHHASSLNTISSLHRIHKSLDATAQGFPIFSNMAEHADSNIVYENLLGKSTDWLLWGVDMPLDACRHSTCFGESMKTTSDKSQQQCVSINDVLNALLRQVYEIENTTSVDHKESSSVGYIYPQAIQYARSKARRYLHFGCITSSTNHTERCNSSPSVIHATQDTLSYSASQPCSTTRAKQCRKPVALTYDKMQYLDGGLHSDLMLYGASMYTDLLRVLRSATHIPKLKELWIQAPSKSYQHFFVQRISNSTTNDIEIHSRLESELGNVHSSDLSPSQINLTSTANCNNNANGSGFETDSSSVRIPSISPLHHWSSAALLSSEIAGRMVRCAQRRSSMESIQHESIGSNKSTNNDSQQGIWNDSAVINDANTGNISVTFYNSFPLQSPGQDKLTKQAVRRVINILWSTDSDDVQKKLLDELYCVCMSSSVDHDLFSVSMNFQRQLRGFLSGIWRNSHEYSKNMTALDVHLNDAIRLMRQSISRSSQSSDGHLPQGNEDHVADHLMVIQHHDQRLLTLSEVVNSLCAHLQRSVTECLHNDIVDDVIRHPKGTILRNETNNLSTSRKLKVTTGNEAVAETLRLMVLTAISLDMFEFSLILPKDTPTIPTNSTTISNDTNTSLYNQLPELFNSSTLNNCTVNTSINGCIMSTDIEKDSRNNLLVVVDVMLKIASQMSFVGSAKNSTSSQDALWPRTHKKRILKHATNVRAPSLMVMADSHMFIIVYVCPWHVAIANRLVESWKKFCGTPICRSYAIFLVIPIYPSLFSDYPANDLVGKKNHMHNRSNGSTEKDDDNYSFDTSVTDFLGSMPSMRSVIASVQRTITQLVSAKDVVTVLVGLEALISLPQPGLPSRPSQELYSLLHLKNHTCAKMAVKHYQQLDSFAAEISRHFKWFDNNITAEQSMVFQPTLGVMPCTDVGGAFKIFDLQSDIVVRAVAARPPIRNDDSHVISCNHHGNMSDAETSRSVHRLCTNIAGEFLGDFTAFTGVAEVVSDMLADIMLSLTPSTSKFHKGIASFHHLAVDSSENCIAGHRCRGNSGDVEIHNALHEYASHHAHIITADDFYSQRNVDEYNNCLSRRESELQEHETQNQPAFLGVNDHQFKERYLDYSEIYSLTSNIMDMIEKNEFSLFERHHYTAPVLKLFAELLSVSEINLFEANFQSQCNCSNNSSVNCSGRNEMRERRNATNNATDYHKTFNTAHLKAFLCTNDYRTFAFFKSRLTKKSKRTDNSEKDNSPDDKSDLHRFSERTDDIHTEEFECTFSPKVYATVQRRISSMLSPSNLKAFVMHRYRSLLSSDLQNNLHAPLSQENRTTATSKRNSTNNTNNCSTSTLLEYKHRRKNHLHSQWILRMYYEIGILSTLLQGYQDMMRSTFFLTPAGHSTHSTIVPAATTPDSNINNTAVPSTAASFSCTRACPRQCDECVSNCSTSDCSDEVFDYESSENMVSASQDEDYLWEIGKQTLEALQAAQVFDVSNIRNQSIKSHCNINHIDGSQSSTNGGADNETYASPQDTCSKETCTCHTHIDFSSTNSPVLRAMSDSEMQVRVQRLFDRIMFPPPSPKLFTSLEGDESTEEESAIITEEETNYHPYNSILHFMFRSIPILNTPLNEANITASSQNIDHIGKIATAASASTYGYVPRSCEKTDGSVTRLVRSNSIGYFLNGQSPIQRRFSVVNDTVQPTSSYQNVPLNRDQLSPHHLRDVIRYELSPMVDVTSMQSPGNEIHNVLFSAISTAGTIDKGLFFSESSMCCKKKKCQANYAHRSSAWSPANAFTDGSLHPSLISVQQKLCYSYNISCPTNEKQGDISPQEGNNESNKRSVLGNERELHYILNFTASNVFLISMHSFDQQASSSRNDINNSSNFHARIHSNTNNSTIEISRSSSRSFGNSDGMNHDSSIEVVAMFSDCLIDIASLNNTINNSKRKDSFAYPWLPTVLLAYDTFDRLATCQNFDALDNGAGNIVLNNLLTNTMLHTKHTHNPQLTYHVLQAIQRRVTDSLHMLDTILPVRFSEESAVPYLLTTCNDAACDTRHCMMNQSSHFVSPLHAKVCMHSQRYRGLDISDLLALPLGGDRNIRCRKGNSSSNLSEYTACGNRSDRSVMHGIYRAERLHSTRLVLMVLRRRDELYSTLCTGTFNQSTSTGCCQYDNSCETANPSRCCCPSKEEESLKVATDEVIRVAAITAYVVRRTVHTFNTWLNTLSSRFKRAEFALSVAVARFDNAPIAHPKAVDNLRYSASLGSNLDFLSSFDNNNTYGVKNCRECDHLSFDLKGNCEEFADTVTDTCDLPWSYHQNRMRKHASSYTESAYVHSERYSHDTHKDSSPKDATVSSHSLQSIQRPPQMHFVTVASMRSLELDALQSSAEMAGIRLQVLGTGQPYHGFLSKMLWYRDFLLGSSKGTTEKSCYRHDNGHTNSAAPSTNSRNNSSIDKDEFHPRDQEQHIIHEHSRSHSIGKNSCGEQCDKVNDATENNTFHAMSEDYNDDDIVLMMDAYDVLLFPHIQHAVTILLRDAPTPILFCGENGLYPELDSGALYNNMHSGWDDPDNSHQSSRVPFDHLKSRNFVSSDSESDTKTFSYNDNDTFSETRPHRSQKFPNAGCVLGRRRDLLRMFHTLIASGDAQLLRDDQWALTRYLLLYPGRASVITTPRRAVSVDSCNIITNTTAPTTEIRKDDDKQCDASVIFDITRHSNTTAKQSNERNRGSDQRTIIAQCGHNNKAEKVFDEGVMLFYTGFKAASSIQYMRWNYDLTVTYHGHPIGLLHLNNRASNWMDEVAFSFLAFVRQRFYSGPDSAALLRVVHLLSVRHDPCAAWRLLHNSSSPIYGNRTSLGGHNSLGDFFVDQIRSMFGGRDPFPRPEESSSKVSSSSVSDNHTTQGDSFLRASNNSNSQQPAVMKLFPPKRKGCIYTPRMTMHTSQQKPDSTNDLPTLVSTTDASYYRLSREQRLRARMPANIHFDCS